MQDVLNVWFLWAWFKGKQDRIGELPWCGWCGGTCRKPDEHGLRISGVSVTRLRKGPNVCKQEQTERGKDYDAEF